MGIIVFRYEKYNVIYDIEINTVIAFKHTVHSNINISRAV